MLISIRVQGFRKFEDLTLPDLSRINILAGNNNVGKTTLLEAIFAFACGTNVAPLVGVSMLRNRQAAGKYDYMEKMLSAFHDRNKAPMSFRFAGEVERDAKAKEVKFHHQFLPYTPFSELNPSLVTSGSGQVPTVGRPQFSAPLMPGLQLVTPEVIGSWTVNSTEPVNITFPPSDGPIRPPLMTARLVDILTHREPVENSRIYSALVRQGRLNELIADLSSIFPEIEGVSVIPYPDGSPAPLTVDVKGAGRVPMYALGDGFQRWFHILGGMVAYPRSLVCIEEGDTTLHPSAHKEFATNLLKYSEKYEVQVFMTTHNIEFLDTFLGSIGESSTPKLASSVRVFTLRGGTGEGGISIRALDGEQALVSRDLYKLDLR